MTPIRILALAIALALPAAQVFATDKASGHYRMDDQRFEVRHGVAVRLWKDAGRETFGVVLGEGPFDATAAKGALDPLEAIAESAPRDSGSLRLRVRRGFEGALKISSLIAQSGSPIPNRNGNEEIAVDGDRIRGEWVKPSTEFMDTSYEITLRFNLPLVEIVDPGKPLSADGGEPGNAYRAFVEAVGKRDAKAMIARMSMPADMVEMIGEESLLEILATNHPASPEILGGWIDGDRAQLRVRGKHTAGQTIHVAVELTKVDGAWKVGDSALR
jgi:hypothetical protein